MRERMSRSTLRRRLRRRNRPGRRPPPSPDAGGDDDGASPPGATAAANSVVARGRGRPRNRGSADGVAVVAVVVAVARRRPDGTGTSRGKVDDGVRRTMTTPRPGEEVVDGGEKDRMPTTQHPANTTNGILDLMPGGVICFPASLRCDVVFLERERDIVCGVDRRTMFPKRKYLARP
jgi:hypothetical protein